MAKGAGQKRKTLILARVLLERTDEDHTMTVPELITALEAEGVTAERKSVYDDLEALRGFGLDVQSRKGRAPGWFIGERPFQLPELKLLVDAVQSCKFITRRKSDQLIGKLEGLTSVWQARQLQRQVYVDRRVKTMNESVYYSIDTLHAALAEGRGVRFRYFEYNVRKEKVFRREGAWYAVFPHGLIWDDENYYLVGFDSQAGIIKHFRVDKMAQIGTTEEPRDGQEVYAALDMGLYARQVFGMFSGEPVWVRLRFDRGLVGAVLDRLGQEVMLVPEDEEHFTVRTQVVVSPQFFGWLCGFGKRAKVLEPENVVNAMAEYVENISQMYKM